MKLYRGRRESDRCVVTVVLESGIEEPLDPRFDLRRHSPDGFNWGYCGSGPAQLAVRGRNATRRLKPSPATTEPIMAGRSIGGGNRPVPRDHQAAAPVRTTSPRRMAVFRTVPATVIGTADAADWADVSIRRSSGLLVAVVLAIGFSRG